MSRGHGRGVSGIDRRHPPHRESLGSTHGCTPLHGSSGCVEGGNPIWHRKFPRPGSWLRRERLDAPVMIDRPDSTANLNSRDGNDETGKMAGMWSARTPCNQDVRLDRYSRQVQLAGRLVTAMYGSLRRRPSWTRSPGSGATRTPVSVAGVTATETGGREVRRLWIEGREPAWSESGFSTCVALAQRPRRGSGRSHDVESRTSCPRQTWLTPEPFDSPRTP